MKKITELQTHFLRNGILSIALCIASYTQTRIIEKDYMISYRQEIVNGKTFKHRIDVDDKQKREVFAINDEPVSADVFEEAMLEAERLESKEQRQAERKLRIRKMRAHQKMQLKVSLAELRDNLSILQKEVKPLLDDRLEAYFVFSSDAIPDMASFSNIIAEFIPNIRQLLVQPIKEQELRDVELIKERVKEKIVAVKKLLADTIDQVIEKADDTQLLKELLALVS